MCKNHFIDANALRNISNLMAQNVGLISAEASKTGVATSFKVTGDEVKEIFEHLGQSRNLS